MSQANRERMWTWILRFVNVVRFLAWTIFAMTVVTYAIYLKEFLATKQFGAGATIWFVAGLVASLASMFLWLNNYKHTAHMIRHQTLSEPRLLRVGYNLLSLYALEWLATFREWFGPEFAMTKVSNIGTETPKPPVEGSVEYSVQFPALNLSENIPYITPVTEGMATLVLAFVLIYWAKSVSENRRLQSELNEII